MVLIIRFFFTNFPFFFFLLNVIFYSLSKNDFDIKMYQTNEEELKKKVRKLQLKLKEMSRHSKQLTEENNIDKHVTTLMSEIKIKEDAFEIEKNQLTTDNQFLKKKILTLETNLVTLNSKVSLKIIHQFFYVGLIHLYTCR